MRCARAVGSRQFAPGVCGRQSCIPQIPPCFGELKRLVSEAATGAMCLGRWGAIQACGGRKGGKARAEKLTPEQRSEIARKAAKARWAKKRQQEQSS
jgi:hypothetical protein